MNNFALAALIASFLPALGFALALLNLDARMRARERAVAHIHRRRL